ncbi:Histidine kinase-like ATPase domain-containing protein [Mucilaginibacter polytrichastri]|nr:Histidine kinase-like ATPase domain-containing protein [Mucilaginibacter polytrichastri]
MPADALEEMLAVIKTHVHEDAGMHELLFKSKFILTELLTNAIKHANTSQVSLNLEITDALVKFVKTDYGNPFMLPQIKDEQFKDALIITADVMHTLYAKQKEELTYFYCHENEAPSINLDNDLPEHFGLLIITKAADEFFYHFDEQNRANTFTATINL